MFNYALYIHYVDMCIDIYIYTVCIYVLYTIVHIHICASKYSHILTCILDLLLPVCIAVLVDMGVSENRGP